MGKKLSLKKPGDWKIPRNLAVRKFNKEKSKFANYLGEIWGRSELQRRWLATQNTRPLLPFCVRKTSG
jgi:hypothetical protein